MARVIGRCALVPHASVEEDELAGDGRFSVEKRTALLQHDSTGSGATAPMVLNTYKKRQTPAVDMHPD